MSDLDLVVSAVREAGKLALQHQARPINVTEKPDGAGPVTEADMAVDELLKQRLLDSRPDHGWLSEETPDNTDRLGPSRTFIVDPIDGTRSFIAGSKDWAHSVAIVEDGRAVVGVVYLPARDALYAAEAGQGATLNGDPLIIGDAPAIGCARVLTTKPSLAPEHWHGNAPPPFERHFRSSLAWRLCLVAEGAFDAMLTLRPAWEWDIAAGALIAAEAGAKVTDRAGAALTFNKSWPQSDGVLVAQSGLHQQISERLV
ncbi:3'(2'),5'-bisphosphate nucleotidase CysQ [Alexandriicola marinus]|uniref:3'(2'),5'-bisphosphate nucleotidase CysQ n=1 Tax=Alexandriicola marinus TaxID=2081710 RepID=UPI0030B84C50